MLVEDNRGEEMLVKDILYMDILHADIFCAVTRTYYTPIVSWDFSFRDA